MKDLSTLDWCVIAGAIIALATLPVLYRLRTKRDFEYHPAGETEEEITEWIKKTHYPVSKKAFQRQFRIIPVCYIFTMQT